MGLLRDCEIIANLRITFASSSSDDPPPAELMLQIIIVAAAECGRRHLAEGGDNIYVHLMRGRERRGEGEGGMSLVTILNCIII